MDILLTLFTIWMVTFILSFAANNAQASNEKKIADRDMRSVSMVVAWLASQELTKPRKEKANG